MSGLTDSATGAEPSLRGYAMKGNMGVSNDPQQQAGQKGGGGVS